MQLVGAQEEVLEVMAFGTEPRVGQVPECCRWGGYCVWRRLTPPPSRGLRQGPELRPGFPGTDLGSGGGRGECVTPMRAWDPCVGRCVCLSPDAPG